METMALYPCAACARHVRVSDPSCPFCGVTLSVTIVSGPVAHPAARSRAALVFGTVAALAVAGACSPPAQSPPPVVPTSPEDTSPSGIYGAPPPTVEDAGAPSPVVPTPPKPPVVTRPGDEPAMGTVYGAPPPPKVVPPKRAPKK